MYGRKGKQLIFYWIAHCILCIVIMDIYSFFLRLFLGFKISCGKKRRLSSENIEERRQGQRQEPEKFVFKVQI